LVDFQANDNNKYNYNISENACFEHILFIGYLYNERIYSMDRSRTDTPPPPTYINDIPDDYISNNSMYDKLKDNISNYTSTYSKLKNNISNKVRGSGNGNGSGSGSGGGSFRKRYSNSAKKRASRRKPRSAKKRATRSYRRRM
jgi:hypothetical protein